MQNITNKDRRRIQKTLCQVDSTIPRPSWINAVAITFGSLSLGPTVKEKLLKLRKCGGISCLVKEYLDLLDAQDMNGEGVPNPPPEVGES
jgi:hypothetical protein